MSRDQIIYKNCFLKCLDIEIKNSQVTPFIYLKEDRSDADLIERYDFRMRSITSSEKIES